MHAKAEDKLAEENGEIFTTIAGKVTSFKWLQQEQNQQPLSS